MKKIKFKQNIPIIIFNILIVILFSSMFLRHYFFENGAKNIMYARERYNACVELVNADENERESMIEKYEEEYGFLLEIEDCEKLASFENPPKSAVNLYLDIVSRNDFSNYIIPYFVPLLILFPFIYKLSKEFKSKYIKSYILRDGYKNYVKNIFKQAYSNIWVVPLMFFVLALISYLIAGHVDTSADNYLNYLIAPVELFFKPSFWDKKNIIFQVVISLFRLSIIVARVLRLAAPLLFHRLEPNGKPSPRPMDFLPCRGDPVH